MPKILYYDLHLPHLLIDSEKPVGGATVQLNAWLYGFSEIGVETGVLTFKNASTLVNGSSLPFKLIDTHKRNGIPILRWFYNVVPSLYKAIKFNNPEYIIKAGAGFQVAILMLISKIFKASFIYRVANDMDLDERIKERIPLFSRVLFNFGLKKSCAIICQNEYQIQKVKEKYPHKPTIVLYNPFYFNGNKPIIKKFKDRKYVAWVGVFSKKKNPALLLDIVKLHPKIEFKIAGRATTHIDNSTKSILKKLEKQPNVEFVGYLKRNEILEFLSSAYFLLNTSLYEGFSNAYLEALFVGTPIVTSSKNDPDVIIEKYNLGLIIDKHTSENDFNKLLNEEIFNTISLNAQEYVLKNHNPVVLAEKLIHFLEKIRDKN